MKKLIIAAAFFAATLSVLSVQTQRRYMGTDQQMYLINGFTSTLSPAFVQSDNPNVQGQRVLGISFAFTAPVTTTVEVSYVRSGVTNIVYSETGTGTTFSWQGNIATGHWLLMPTDTLLCTSSDPTEAQLTIILED